MPGVAQAGGGAGGAFADPRGFLAGLFQAAVEAVSAASCLPPHLPAPPAGRTVVVGAGKAAAAMAQVVEERWRGPVSGLVVTRYGHGVPCEHIRVVEAGHPLPDEAGLQAAEDIRALAAGLTGDDLLVCLLSGGGSALLALPAEGISLADKQSLGRELLGSGATIAEINCVRKHLSAIKGGRLAALAFPARVVSLVISDVPDDDPSVIASGPTVADPTTFADALSVLDRYGVEPPTGVREYLKAGLRGEAQETLKPGDHRLASASLVIVADSAAGLRAAAAQASRRGVRPLDLGGAVEGEARRVARRHAELVRDVVDSIGRPKRVGMPCETTSVPGAGDSSRLPLIILSGGETTVTVRGHGRGGRNCEYLLALALALDGLPGVYALAADTDGVDGTEDNAGAFTGPDTLERAVGLGMDPAGLLRDNDSYRFFSRLGDLLVTGPTRTNVNDFRAILITPGER